MGSSQSRSWLVPAIAALVVIAAVGAFAYFWVVGQQTPAATTAALTVRTPRAYVTAYYQAILDKQWQTAFDLQPAASKSGTVADFQATQTSYGMTAFSIFSEVAGSADATVVVRQDLGGNGIWNSTWTLSLASGQWVAKTRKLVLGEPGASAADSQLPPGKPPIGDTSTTVPSELTPRDYVAAYYQAILDKQWQKAFDMQPEASKAGQTVAAFQQTQEQMYGMTSFSIFSAVTSGSSATVVARQVLGANGVWNTTWSFVNDGGKWRVTTRKVASGEPAK